MIINHSANIWTKKTESIIFLDKNNYSIPDTLIYEKINLSEVIDQLLQSDFNNFYARYIFRDNIYPHYYGKLITKENMSEQLFELYDGIKNTGNLFGNLVIQPLIDNYISGSIISVKDYYLVEVVYGAPPQLFREGKLLYRALVNNNIIIDEQLFQQKNIKFWDGSWKEKRNNLSFSPSCLHKLFHQKYLCNKLYEFGIDHNNNLFFYEIKDIQDDTFLTLRSGKITLPFVIYKNENKFFTKNSEKKILLEKPHFSYMPEVIDVNNAYYIKSGPFSAHLSTFLSDNKVNCIYI